MVDTSAPASRLDTDPRRAHVSLSKHPYQIGVFGSGTIGPRVYELAYQVGAEIAKQGHILISGGMTGTMEASSRGASDADGLVVASAGRQVYRWQCLFHDKDSERYAVCS